MAHWVGLTGRLYGFEPTPRIHAAALANCRHNGAHQVEIAQVAVADREGEARFEDSSEQPNHGISHLSEQGSVTVRVVTLDRTIPAAAPVSLIKINLHSYSWEELLAAFPYQVRVWHVPARREGPHR
jgi:FkbM family methyltransferase